MAEWAYNPITGNLDRIGDGGGGGGNITISGDSGPPLFANTFAFVGQEAGTVPVVDVDTSTGDVAISSNTWETQYVVDNSTTAGLKGTFATVQDAMNQAYDDGNANFPLYANIMLRPGDYDLSALNIPDDANFHIYSVMPSTENTNGNVRINGIGTLSINTSSNILWENLFFADVPTFGAATGFNTFKNVSFANGAVFNGGVPLFINSYAFGAGDIILNDTLGVFQAKDSFFSNVVFNVSTNESFNFYSTNCTYQVLSGTCAGNLKMFSSPFVAITANCSSGVDAQNVIVNCSNAGSMGLSTNPTITGTGEFYVAEMSGYTYGPAPTIFNLASTQGNVIASKTVSADYSASIFDYYIGVDDTSSARTITLPDPSDALTRLSLNQSFIVKDESLAAGTNSITINTVGGLIDGAASTVIDTNGGCLTFKSNGTNYFII